MKKLLKTNPSPEGREKGIRQIIPLYCRMGKYEKAKSLANAQPSLVICKELLLPMATAGKEKARYQGERVLALLSNLQFAIAESIALRPSLSSSEYGKKLLLSVINLYETFFVDGRLGSWHWNIGRLYLTLAGYEMANNGSLENILFYFDKGFDHCEEYECICNENEYIYTSPLVSDLPAITIGELIPIGHDYWKKELKTYQHNIVDEIRKNPKYAKCFE